MSYSLRKPSATEPFIELALTGSVDPQELEGTYRDTFALCETTDCYRVLADLTELTGGHSVVDLYGLVTAITELGIADRFREAVVIGQASSGSDLGRFFETAGLNRGIPIQIFTDRDAAATWLTA